MVDEALLERNLVILKQVIDRTGCKILLAQKAFSMFACYPLIGSYLNGTTASGLFEARLGKEEIWKRNYRLSMCVIWKKKCLKSITVPDGILSTENAVQSMTDNAMNEKENFIAFSF